jgi:hypothetical protein
VEVESKRRRLGENMPSSSSSSSSIFLLSLVLLFLFCNTKALIKLPPNETVPAVIAFGDSIADTGNNNHLKTVVKCNFPPYGKDFQGEVPTGRFGNGKVTSDLIGSSLSLSLCVCFYALGLFLCFDCVVYARAIKVET